MTPIEKLLEELASTYDFLEPIYLSGFFKDDGKKWLYDKLQAQYQSVYANNQRIVVVQDCADHYDYANMPGQSIVALQKYASQIDISNSFILH